MSDKIKVLVVDDSLLVRRILSQLINNEPDMEVIGEAVDPIEARAMLQKNPDVMTLDVEMPRMDGITFLEKLMKLRPMPVVMVSSLTDHGAEVTFKALELGAFDFVPKPKLAVGDTKLRNGFDIITKIRAAYAARDYYRRKSAQNTANMPIISIITGMGGTGVIRNVLDGVHQNSPPVLVWHAFPEGFVRAFADRLSDQLALPVSEALPNTRFNNGQIYLLPVGLQSLLSWDNGHYVLKCQPTSEPGRPSVDMWLSSIADVAGAHGTAAILTSYGEDGAAGASKMVQSGGHVFVQTPETCVVPDLAIATLSRIPELNAMDIETMVSKLSDIVV